MARHRDLDRETASIRPLSTQEIVDSLDRILGGEGWRRDLSGQSLVNAVTAAVGDAYWQGRTDAQIRGAIDKAEGNLQRNIEDTGANNFVTLVAGQNTTGLAVGDMIGIEDNDTVADGNIRTVTKIQQKITFSGTAITADFTRAQNAQITYDGTTTRRIEDTAAGQTVTLVAGQNTAGLAVNDTIAIHDDDTVADGNTRTVTKIQQVITFSGPAITTDFTRAKNAHIYKINTDWRVRRSAHDIVEQIDLAEASLPIKDVSSGEEVELVEGESTDGFATGQRVIIEDDDTPSIERTITTINSVTRVIEFSGGAITNAYTRANNAHIRRADVIDSYWRSPPFFESLYHFLLGGQDGVVATAKQKIGLELESNVGGDPMITLANNELTFNEDSVVVLSAEFRLSYKNEDPQWVQGVGRVFVDVLVEHYRANQRIWTENNRHTLYLRYRETDPRSTIAATFTWTPYDFVGLMSKGDKLAFYARINTDQPGNQANIDASKIRISDEVTAKIGDVSSGNTVTLEAGESTMGLARGTVIKIVDDSDTTTESLRRITAINPSTRVITFGGIGGPGDPGQITESYTRANNARIIEGEGTRSTMELIRLRAPEILRTQYVRPLRGGAGVLRHSFAGGAPYALTPNEDGDRLLAFRTNVNWPGRLSNDTFTIHIDRYNPDTNAILGAEQLSVSQDGVGNNLRGTTHRQMAGAAYKGSTLYYVGPNGLYSFNAGLTSVTYLGTITGSPGSLGTPRAMCALTDPDPAIDDQLYLLGHGGNGALIAKLDPATRIFSDKHFLSFESTAIHDVYVLAAHAGTLYTVERGDPWRLFSIDPATGTLTRVSTNTYNNLDNYSFQTLAGFGTLDDTNGLYGTPKNANDSPFTLYRIS